MTASRQANPGAQASQISTLIEAQKAAFLELSDCIWENPELNFKENYACSLHEQRLVAAGFRVTPGVGDLPTALLGEAGEGGPVIAVLGEYDALPELSQQAGVAQIAAVHPGGHGHGCGHNMLGSASLLAAVGLYEFLKTNNLPGRVRYYGCPAEEGGSAKGFMVRAGLFDDVDAALCWHPAFVTGVNRPFSLACAEFSFLFKGRASHASSAPHLGRSALDAVELMNVGVNYMREHMPPTARIHYAIIDGGGTAANVVQARAVVQHLIRARNLPEMWELVERVKKVAQGASLMTETEVHVKQLSGDANLVGNTVLEGLMHENLVALGSPGFDAADQAFAATFQETLSREVIEEAYTRFGLPVKMEEESLSNDVYPQGGGSDTAAGSTDVGSVSWVVPTVQCRVACYAMGTPGHSWQLVAQGKAPAAHKGLVHAAKAMAAVGADLFVQPEALAAAQAEFKAFRAKNEFRNPITDDMEPDFPEGAGPAR